MTTPSRKAAHVIAVLVGPSLRRRRHRPAGHAPGVFRRAVVGAVAPALAAGSVTDRIAAGAGKQRDHLKAHTDKTNATNAAPALLRLAQDEEPRRAWGEA
jgi:hypothetical protein